MKRRRLIVGLGGLAGLGGSVIGTGAFTSVSAERDVTVETADDANAFLAMEPIDSPNGDAFATTEDGLVLLEFTSTEAGGTGLGTDSVYDFDDVFRITNQGTQPVYVWATFADASGEFEVGSSDTDVWFYADGDSDNKLRDSADDVLYLTPGANADIGVHIDTDNVSQDQELTATINANANKPADDGGVVGGGATRIDGPTNGLVNYWPLNNVGSGGVADIVGTTAATASGGVSATSGRVGSAASFDGDDGVITTDVNPGGPGESLTVSGWLKAPSQSVSRNHFFLSNYPDKSHDGFFAIGTNDGDELFFWGRDREKEVSKLFGRTDDAFDDGWHHYAGVRDAGNNELRFYVDGSRVGAVEFSGDVAINDSNSTFGIMQHFGNRNLEGTVDDVRIYARALTDDEVSTLYDAVDE